MKEIRELMAINNKIISLECELNELKIRHDNVTDTLVSEGYRSGTRLMIDGIFYEIQKWSDNSLHLVKFDVQTI